MAERLVRVISGIVLDLKLDKIDSEGRNKMKKATKGWGDSDLQCVSILRWLSVNSEATCGWKGREDR